MLQGRITSTQKECQWIMPSFQNISYAPVKDLDFTSAKGRKKNLDGALMDSTGDTTSVKHPKEVDMVSSPTDGEIDNIYKKLSKSSSNSAILSIILPYAKDFQPKSTLSSFPQALPELFREEYLKLNYIQLLDICSIIY